MYKRLLTPEEIIKKNSFKERLAEIGYILSDPAFDNAFIAFTEMEAHIAKVDKAKLDRPELERKIDLKALAGTHRVIPFFKEYCDGEVIDAYLTSASITKILKNILALIPDEEEIRK